MVKDVYLLWTYPEWCRDGCCYRLRGVFLDKSEAALACERLERDEPDSDHVYRSMLLGRVSDES